MTLTLQFRIFPTTEEASLLDASSKEYVSTVNALVDYFFGQGEIAIQSTSEFIAMLPSAVKNQVLRDAKSVYKKSCKTGILSVLKKPVIIWNNQNYTVTESFVSVPLLVNGKSKRISIFAKIPQKTLEILRASKLGTLRITKKNRKYIAQISCEVAEGTSADTGVVGVDLGIKCPAVAVFSDDAVKFYGNGRKNKFIRRCYGKRRKKLGKAKKLSAIRKMNNKEQRWMKDQDHKISRAIVNDAIAHKVGTIKLETLAGIRKATRNSRKNNRSLYSWSFARLASFIGYKARREGIAVVYINPAYTSQTCPICGGVHHAKDRQYVCPDCGYHSHRDIIGARNILVA